MPLLRAVFKFLASLKLAIILLAVLLYVCAMGTYYESKYNAEVARALIYHAWWFTAWMMLLVANLFCAAMSRYPWKPHQTGFVITHAGIITLLIGGMIDRRWGLEGFLHLRRGSMPLNEASLNSQDLLVFSPHRSDPARTVVNVQADMHLLISANELDPGDVKSLPDLCRALAEAGRVTRPSPGKRFWRSIPEERQPAVQALAENPGAKAQPALDALNRALHDRDVYHAKHFEGVALTDEAQELLAFDRYLLSDKEVLRLNQLLLAASYPDLVNTARFKRSPKSVAVREPGMEVCVLDCQGVTSSVTGIVAKEDGSPILYAQLDLGGSPPFGLKLGGETQMGPAVFRFLKGAPEKLSQEPEAAEQVPLLQRHYVFSIKDHPEMVISLSGKPADAKGELVVDETGSRHLLKLVLKEKSFEIPILEHLKQPYALAGLPDYSVQITGFYPHFMLNEKNQPTTLSEKLENPCVVFELKGPLVPQEAAADPHASLPDPGTLAAVTIYLSEDGGFSYVNESHKSGEQTKETLEIGKPVTLPWGMKPKFTLLAYEASGDVLTSWRPVSMEGHMGGGTYSGFLCEVRAGEERQRIWAGPLLTYGDTGAPLTIGGRTIGLAYDTRVAKLPFTVQLADTIAQNQEGLIGSDSFMNFESTLSFDGLKDTVEMRTNANLPDFLLSEVDRHTLRGTIKKVTPQHIHFLSDSGEEAFLAREDVAGFERRTRRIYMNNPTFWPPPWYGPWLGTCYKFSQSDHGLLHDPPDPFYSGVQVLVDPGWLPKWVGSLMICFGIFTMFYLKPYFRRQPVPRSADAEESPVKQAAPAKAEVVLAEQRGD